jgi:hypothetical protein
MVLLYRSVLYVVRIDDGDGGVKMASTRKVPATNLEISGRLFPKPIRLHPWHLKTSKKCTALTRSSASSRRFYHDLTLPSPSPHPLLTSAHLLHTFRPPRPAHVVSIRHTMFSSCPATRARPPIYAQRWSTMGGNDQTNEASSRGLKSAPPLDLWVTGRDADSGQGSSSTARSLLLLSRTGDKVHMHWNA